MVNNPYNKRPWLKRYDQDVPSHIIYPDYLVHEMLEISTAKFGNQPCLIMDDASFTYHEVNEQCNQLAAFFQGRKMAKGDRVGIILPNSPQFIIAFYGVLKAGGVVVAINPQFQPQEISRIILDSRIKWILALEDNLEKVKQLPELRSIKCFINMDLRSQGKARTGAIKNSSQHAIHSRQNTAHLVEILSDFSDTPPKKMGLNIDAPAIFQYSGGTTGLPKAAIGTHRNLVSNTIQFRKWLPGMVEGEEVVLAALPLYHVYGMVLAMNLGIYMGGKLVIPKNSRDAEELLTLIEKHHVTFFPGVPNMYSTINKHPRVISGKVKMDSIKACISGSAPLPIQTKIEFERSTGGKVLEGYGLSEAPTATHCNPMFGENRTGSIGLPLPDVDCRIVDTESGRSMLPVGEKGELIIKGPQVMKGYHHQPLETKKTLRKGWLYTGDIAYMDRDGYFYLVDRKKDLIKIGGFQVWPHEIEEILLKHPSVQDAGVAGVLDEDRFEKIKAWIVVRTGEKLTKSAIIAWCSHYLSAYKVPKEIEFCEKLPRTAIGKLLRRELVRENFEKK